MRNRLPVAIAVVLLTQGMAPTSSRADYLPFNLVSDIGGLAWEMSFSSMSPIWVSNQESNTATLSNPLGSPSKQGLVVTPPTSGIDPLTGPTGQVFNSSTCDFIIPAPGSTSIKSRFLYATLEGTVQGWTLASETTATDPGLIFTGLALNYVSGSDNPYTADVPDSIRVFDTKFANVTGTFFAGKFVDPNPNAGFTAYNIQNPGGNLFVPYEAASRTGARLPGGYVDDLNSSDDFLERIATNDVLIAPRGWASAPNSSGTFGGDLLVGNVFDSKTNALNLTTKNLDGSIPLKTISSSPAGQWGFSFGDGKTDDRNTMYIIPGAKDQTDGLLRTLAPALRMASLVLLALGLPALVGYGLKRWYDKADVRVSHPLRPSTRVWQL